MRPRDDREDSMTPLVLIPQFFGCLVFDRRTSRYMPFDSESTAVLRHLARPDAGGIDSLFDSADSPDRAGALRGFYRHFYRRGFFNANGHLAATVLDVDPPDDHLVGPLAVHLEIIAACNLTCSHCFAGVLPRNQAPMRVAEMDDLFAELAGMGSFRLGLTGGEPLLRTDLFDIIDSATARGLHPCLTTNGLLITDDIARQLGKRDLVWINVSLDGATRASNDAIRGPGTFDRVRDRLRILARHARFTLAFTITSQNAGEIEECARLAREVGAHTAVFRPLYPVGIAQRNMHLLSTFAQYTGALRRLARSEVPRGGDAHSIDPFSPMARRDIQAKIYRNNGCGAANLVASISVNGNVNPCSFLGPGHDSGNLRQRSFGDIWHHSAGFSQMRGMSAPTGCASCPDDKSSEGKNRFRGGCRARAMALSGDIDASDPWHDQWLREAGREADHVHPMSNIDVDC